MLWLLFHNTKTLYCNVFTSFSFFMKYLLETCVLTCTQRSRLSDYFLVELIIFHIRVQLSFIIWRELHYESGWLCYFRKVWGFLCSNSSQSRWDQMFTLITRQLYRWLKLHQHILSGHNSLQTSLYNIFYNIFRWLVATNWVKRLCASQYLPVLLLWWFSW